MSLTAVSFSVKQKLEHNQIQFQSVKKKLTAQLEFKPQYICLLLERQAPNGDSCYLRPTSPNQDLIIVLLFQKWRLKLTDLELPP